MEDSFQINTIIIGAGAAGLACAACLQREGIPHILLEQSDIVGSEWGKRYDRLHLHTTKIQSALPYFKMPSHYPKYLSKRDFEQYLNDYAKAFRVQPRFNQKVVRVLRFKDHWLTVTSDNTYLSSNVLVTTGYARKPVAASIDGIQNYQGEFIHSAAYTNGKKYHQKKVLVIGFGNSACEIAICLHEHGAFPALSVRSTVNVLPREIAGISVLNIALAQKWLIKISPELADAVNKPILNFINGNIRKYGLNPTPYGPVTQIVRHKRVPLLDIGTMKLIRRGKVKVYPAIAKIVNNAVHFVDGRTEYYDAIISATGYLPAVDDFIENCNQVCDAAGTPLTSGTATMLPGLYFCGYNVSPTGMLREIGIEAKQIVDQLKRSGVVTVRH